MSAALLLCGLGAFAQQNLFISQDIQSAIVNDDHSVTFNFFAPKAHRVQIAGDFVTGKDDNKNVAGMVGSGLNDRGQGRYMDIDNSPSPFGTLQL